MSAVIAIAVYMLSVLLYLLWVFCFVRIFKKAGLGYWGLSSIIVILAPVLLLLLAFAEWPIAEKAAQPTNAPSPL